MLRRVIVRTYGEAKLNMRGLLAVLDGSLSPTDSKTLFSKIDADQDGKFHITEIKSALAGDIIQMESIILKLLDDVMVPMPTTNFADFMIFVAQRKKGTNKIRQVFEIMKLQEYDKDGSNSIDPHEVKEWLQIRGKFITGEQANKVVENMDYTGDGMVDYNEFLAMIIGRLLYIKLK